MFKEIVSHLWIRLNCQSNITPPCAPLTDSMQWAHETIMRVPFYSFSTCPLKGLCTALQARIKNDYNVMISCWDHWQLLPRGVTSSQLTACEQTLQRARTAQPLIRCSDYRTTRQQWGECTECRHQCNALRCAARRNSEEICRTYIIEARTAHLSDLLPRFGHITAKIKLHITFWNTSCHFPIYLILGLFYSPQLLQGSKQPTLQPNENDIKGSVKRLMKILFSGSFFLQIQILTHLLQFNKRMSRNCRR